MTIVVDEAGSFARAPRKRWSVSCVGALIVPAPALADLEMVIPRLKWGVAGEVKGRELTEQQAHQLITLLSADDIVFTIQLVDMATEAEWFIEQPRKGPGA